MMSHLISGWRLNFGFCNELPLAVLAGDAATDHQVAEFGRIHYYLTAHSEVRRL